jgi:hypothetical protein
MCCCRSEGGGVFFGGQLVAKNIVLRVIISKAKNMPPPGRENGQPESAFLAAICLWPAAITYTALLGAGVVSLQKNRGRALCDGIESSNSGFSKFL